MAEISRLPSNHQDEVNGHGTLNVLALLRMCALVQNHHDCWCQEWQHTCTQGKRAMLFSYQFASDLKWALLTVDHNS